MVTIKYQIGDFSKISRLSIKTLRYYHEIKLLCPNSIDNDTGYRFYDDNNLEQANIICKLKNLDFSLKEIKAIIENYSDDDELIEIMKNKLTEINEKIKAYKIMEENINNFINENKGEYYQMEEKNNISIKEIDDLLIASIRFKGSYIDIGSKLSKLYKACGRHSIGSPFSLYYDEGYKEDEADIEICLNVKREINTNEIKSRILKGGKAICVTHKGEYSALGRSYKILIDYKNSEKLSTLGPCREIYIKGPGMILSGNPKNYLTEIQFIIDD